MEMQGKPTSDLPPGFRFHPTDEELIIYYLKNQATSMPCPASIIPEVDIYKFDPWQLPEKAEFGENEWYFFSPRDRKYPNGVRPNRATISGYWKATGTDKGIYSGPKYVGIKKALVFYTGKPPRGVKTNWIMHEYRLNEPKKYDNYKHKGSMRLDDWVLCRIYKKKQIGRQDMEEGLEISHTQMDMNVTTSNDTTSDDSQMTKFFPRTSSLAHLLELDQYMGPITKLLSDNISNPNFGLQNYVMNANHVVRGGTHDHFGKVELGEGMSNNSSQYNADSGMLLLGHEPPFMNPIMYEFQ